LPLGRAYLQACKVFEQVLRVVLQLVHAFDAQLLLLLQVRVFEFQRFVALAFLVELLRIEKRSPLALNSEDDACKATHLGLELLNLPVLDFDLFEQVVILLGSLIKSSSKRPERGQSQCAAAYLWAYLI
jgi:hypothetical protein